MSVSKDKRSPADLIDQAKRHQQDGDLALAADLSRQALQLDPNNAEGAHVFGLVRFQQKRTDEALDYLRRADRLDPGNGAIRNSLGLVLMQKGDLDGAEEAFRESLAIGPRFLRAHLNLATVLRRQGRLQEAVEALRRAIDINRDFAPAHFALAEAYSAHGHDGNSLFHMGLGHAAERRPDTACDFFQRAVAREPDNPSFHHGLGNIQLRLGMVDEALESFQRALALRPGYRGAVLGLALALGEANLHDLALTCFEWLIRSGPATVEAHIGRAQTLLLLGRYEEGWAEFEARLERPMISQEAVRQPFSKPQWDGRPLPDSRLLVHTEQGKGDNIQFARFLPLVKERVGHVIFECEPELMPLMTPLGGYDALVEKHFSRDMPYPEHDYHISLISLPHLFGTTLDTIPDHVPYLGAPVDRVQAWRERIDGSGLRVGLAWAGNPLHPNDHLRSIKPAGLEPIAKIPGLSLYSLQVGEAAATMPPGLRAEPVGRDFADFADTAAVMSHLDLIITVDTSTAHLAGALGREVWTLLPFKPDWRWLLDRDDTPWYPTMRLFRQPRPRDWDSVIETVCGALRRRAAESN